MVIACNSSRGLSGKLTNGLVSKRSAARRATRLGAPAWASAGVSAVSAHDSANAHLDFVALVVISYRPLPPVCLTYAPAERNVSRLDECCSRQTGARRRTFAPPVGIERSSTDRPQR